MKDPRLEFSARFKSFDLCEAAAGCLVCREGGETTARFLHGPDMCGMICVHSNDGQLCLWHVDFVRMVPFCVVEDTPVYLGDTLYRKDTGKEVVVSKANCYDLELLTSLSYEKPQVEVHKYYVVNKLQGFYQKSDAEDFMKACDNKHHLLVEAKYYE